jgi:HSP20 family protein
MSQAAEKREATRVTQVPARTSWPLESFRRDFDQLFERFNKLGWLSRSPIDLDFPFLGDTGAFIGPAVDVSENDNGYEITAELPGLEAKHVEIKVSDSRLTITGEKKEEKEEKGKDRYLSERRYGSFLRSFALPQDVDAAKIEAHFSNGILTIKLPKSADALKREKTIEIKTA